MAVLARLVAKLVGGPAAAGFEAALNKMPTAIADTLAKPAPVNVLPRLIKKEPIFLTGFGIDELSVAEAALKIKGGVYLWAEAMSVELSLHGTPAVFEPRSAAIVAAPEGDDGGRPQTLLTMLKDLHVEAITLGASDHDLPFAKVDYLLRPFVSIIPLQRLVAELARRTLGPPKRSMRTSLRPWRDGEPNQGSAGRSVRRPHLGGDDARQPVAAMVRLDGLRTAVRAAPDRPRLYPPRRRHLRNDPAEAHEDRRPGENQCAPGEDRLRLRLSCGRGVASCSRSARACARLSVMTRAAARAVLAAQSRGPTGDLKTHLPAADTDRAFRATVPHGTY